MEAQDSTYLALCRAQIEDRLDWGPSGEWSTLDFEELSDLIAKKTGRTLGATTLKRVWGRVKYDSNPSQHTLDTLAAFVDATSWRSWKRDEKAPVEAPPRLLSVRERTLSGRTKAWVGAGVSLVAIVVIAIIFFRNGNPVFADSALANVQFASRRVSTGLPNSVVFDYRLTGIEADSFFIQQSWDARLRNRISPDDRQFTSIYYYPGHFWAKLVANDTVLQEHALIVPTDGWMGLIDTASMIPVYADLDTAQFDQLSISNAWLASSDLNLSKGDHVLNYFNVGSFEPDPSESLILESDILVEVEDGHATCRESTIVLIGQHGRISVPFSLPGCSANLNLVASDKQVNGKTNDLSAFGTDLSGWTSITIAMQDRLVFVEIDGEKVYQVPYTTDIGNIVGLRYRFKGLGSIKNVSLRNGIGDTFLSQFTD